MHREKPAGKDDEARFGARTEGGSICHFHCFFKPFQQRDLFFFNFNKIGYYALEEYAKVHPKHDEISTECSWNDLKHIPDLIIDHNKIAEKAIETLRLRLNHEPIGYNLLPKEFTMKDLQSIYETILGKKLDRQNFQRKILSYGILDKKDKHFSGGAQKAPFLYAFNKKKYFEALKTV